MVRRLKDVYVIAGTIQPQSNFNEAPISRAVEITLPNSTDPTKNGTRVRLTVRRQGSMYILNDTLHKGQPVVRQLDGWHESSHLLRWSKSFEFEAELHDRHALEGTERLHTELASTAQHQYDFVNAVTYTAMESGSSLEFTVNPRPVDILNNGATAQVASRQYAVRVRARSKSSTLDSEKGGTGSIWLSHKDSGTELGRVVLGSRTWRWHTMAVAKNLTVIELPTGAPSTVRITAADGPIDLDRVQLSLL